ncbi:PepSY-associated TM helix domain-containing protein [Niabella hibiscisoli]|uniref:PepSY-associated TM helix domain-containing protein n=1 Tax=Niabella hibiscisoli TaxID=1825928 RepID=UPI001F0E0CA6|nr:PepSY-associated TM helix domain-containing protein [Niabella hibiscisoli]MCH5718939.1 PepSY domain-containing protein [Niabella hibiscisoli]
MITGLLLHWNKIVANFYVFRPWEKLKTVWTDLHTALGVISFPFLFIFAVTGSFFLISYPLFTQPTAKIQFGGNEDSLNAVLGYDQRKTEFANIPLQNKADVNYFLEQAAAKWDHTRLSSLQLVNYGDASMEVVVKNALPTQQKFVSSGEIIYKAASGEVLELKDPNRSSGYADVVQNLIYNLHFGNYGGYAVKILYFLLGICGCVVIISGVLIWLTARNKKNIPEKKKRFNEWLTHIYLAISLGMFPVTAAAFIAVKIQPNGGTAFIYPFYFWSWLAVAFLLSIRKNNYKTNRDCMLSGAIIGLAIPIVNGIVTGNWIWVTYNKGYTDILLIDLFWVIVSAAAFTCWWLIVNKQRAVQIKKPLVIEENN